MILALHQPTVTYLRQLLATFIAEVTFFDDFPAMRAGRHFFAHRHYLPTASAALAVFV